MISNLASLELVLLHCPTSKLYSAHDDNRLKLTDTFNGMRGE